MRLTEPELAAKIHTALDLMRGKHRPKEADMPIIALAVARHLLLSVDVESRKALDFRDMNRG